jgi:hypothetical protein
MLPYVIHDASVDQLQSAIDVMELVRRGLTTLTKLKQERRTELAQQFADTLKPRIAKLDDELARLLDVVLPLAWSVEGRPHLPQWRPTPTSR